MGKAVGATGNVDAMAEALAKYKEVKTELNPPSPKVNLFQISIFKKSYLNKTVI